MRGWPGIAAVVTAAGCFAPEPREGLPCSEGGGCPPGQSCSAGVCMAGALAADAAVAIDGPVLDAAPPDPPAPFGAVQPVVLTCPGPVVCADVRDPFLAAEGKTILFTYAVNAVNGNYDIYIANRAAVEQSFGVAVSVGAINTMLSEHAPFLSPDGTRLWFARQDISGGVPTRPYDDIFVSARESGPFNGAERVAGVVNTSLGDERSPQVVAAGTLMLLTRSAETTPLDHDVYLARLEGSQWNTIERVGDLSISEANERSIGLVEERKAIFFIRDEQIHEAIWTGEDPSEVAVEVVHDELDAVPPDIKVSVWSSPDGREVWFDSNRSGTQQIYRAVRSAPTGSFGSPGGRIPRSPIP